MKAVFQRTTLASLLDSRLGKEQEMEGKRQGLQNSAGKSLKKIFEGKR